MRRALFSTLLILTCFASSPFAHGATADDRLMMIREGFRDGLNDTVRQEAELYLKEHSADKNAAEVHLILGFLNLKSQLAKPARSHFKDALKGEKAVASRASYELARLAWTAGDYPEAAERFHQTEMDGQDEKLRSLACFWRGRSLYMAGDCAKAVTVFKQPNPGFSADETRYGHYISARCAYLSKDYPAARSQIQTLINDANLPSELHRDCLVMLAYIDFNKQKYDDSARWIEQAIHASPDTDSLLFRSRLAIHASDWNGAVCWCDETLKQLKAKDPARQEILHLRALSASRAKESAGFEDWYVPLLERLLETTIDESETILEELISQHANPLPPAVASYVTQLEGFDPSKTGLLLAELSKIAGDPDGALNWIIRYLRARKLTQPPPELQTAVIQLLAMSGDSETAARLLELSPQQGSSVKPSANWQLEQAHIHLRKGDAIRAAAEYQSWLVEYPDSPLAADAAYWLGEACVRMGQRPNAISAFERVLDGANVERSAQTELALLKLIECYVAEENWDAISGRLQRMNDLIQTHPDRADLLFYLGYAHARLGKFELALDNLGHAIDAHPREEIAQQAKDLIIRIQTDINGKETDP